MEIINHPSANCGPRRHGGLPDMVVLHYTAMENSAAALVRLCDPKFEVSCHYVIAEDGRIFRLVKEELRAWHGGAGRWGHVNDINSHSIGIELANKGPLGQLPPFPEPQMASLTVLLAQVLSRWNINPARVIGHSDMAIGRKVDPGPKFDWQRLALLGLSVWPETAPTVLPDPVRFLKLAQTFGYGTELGTTDVLTAFRLRFFPGKDGPLDGHDMGVMQELAHRFAVDPAVGAT